MSWRHIQSYVFVVSVWIDYFVGHKCCQIYYKNKTVQWNPIRKFVNVNYIVVYVERIRQMTSINKNCPYIYVKTLVACDMYSMGHMHLPPALELGSSRCLWALIIFTQHYGIGIAIYSVTYSCDTRHWYTKQIIAPINYISCEKLGICGVVLAPCRFVLTFWVRTKVVW